MKSSWLLLPLLLLPSILWGQIKNSETILFRDAKEYISAIERINRLKLEDQIDAWETFLSDHPKNSFREEIRRNIENLERLSPKRNSATKSDQKDAELYLKALEFSKRLTPQDQILLWQQFLDENPTNIYRNEAQIRLNKLKRTTPAGPKTSYRTSPSKNLPARAIEKPTTITPQPIVERQPIKNAEQAVFLASLPGLIVPGMGHWYTEDYVIAGVLTALRIAAIATGAYGIADSQNPALFIGLGLYVLTYGIDIGDAPFSARRYNDAHPRMAAYYRESSGKTFSILSYGFAF